MGGMSSLSFDNVFAPEARDRSEVVSHIGSAGRNPKVSVTSMDAPRGASLPRTRADASSWALSPLRRSMDVFVAAVGLLLFFPMMLLAGALVRFGSPGPVFFRQKRMGRNGKVFILYKFRSMCPKNGNNSFITVSGDTRITRVGAMLRRYKLDELPQFWNVLRGDMSLVGPRPKLPHHEALHMACRPGITGAATLAFRNEEELLSAIPEDQLDTFYEMFVKPAKAHLDLEYVRTASLRSDLTILWRTASACLFSSEDSLAESAEMISHYEEAARIVATKFAPAPARQTMPAQPAYSAGLNPEL